jgi:cytochrome bd-type quinol oxidase subunit 2
MSGPADSVSANERVRRLRIAVLVLAGTSGLSSRWLPYPRWYLLALPLAVMVVWIGTAFQVVKDGETEAQRRQRMRNLAIACALGGLVALFYVGTMIRLGPNVFNRPI